VVASGAKKNETDKKHDMRARRGGRVEGGGQGKNELGAWTVNFGSRGPPQRAAKKRREPRSLGAWRNLGGRSYRVINSRDLPRARLEAPPR